MPSKNDLPAIKLAHKGTLQKTNSVNPPSPSANNVGWRNAKPAAEKQSVVIGLKFTPSQAEVLRNKAGLVPVATYMKDAIFKQTDLFN